MINIICFNGCICSVSDYSVVTINIPAYEITRNQESDCSLNRPRIYLSTQISLIQSNKKD